MIFEMLKYLMAIQVFNIIFTRVQGISELHVVRTHGIFDHFKV